MSKALIFLTLFSFLSARVPVYFTLSLDTFDQEGRLVNEESLAAQLAKAKASGAEGVISDMWWGTVEAIPHHYNFNGYLRLADLVAAAGLELQFTLCFHGCAPEDAKCNKQLPYWVLKAEDAFPRTTTGRVNKEYLSPFADLYPVFAPRTALDAYTQLMEKFVEAFWSHLGITIKQVQIGLGPSGQLRYASYLIDNFCGVGQFLAADRHIKKAFEAHLAAIGKPTLSSDLLSNESYQDSWSAPFFRSLVLRDDQCVIQGKLKIDCGYMGISPEECLYKGCCYAAVAGEPYCYAKGKMNHALIEGKVEDTADGPFGKEFTKFYSQELINHADRVLTAARNVFKFINIGIKLSAVHWTAGSANRAPEMTAGYLVSDDFNFYEKLMPILKKHKTILIISGIEMNNNMSPAMCYSRAKDLTDEVMEIASDAGVEIMGENAWERTDDFALFTINEHAAGLKSVNFMRLGALTSGNEYVTSQLENLIKRLKEIPNTKYSYDVGTFTLRRSSTVTVDCNECRYDPNHLWLH